MNFEFFLFFSFDGSYTQVPISKNSNKIKHFAIYLKYNSLLTLFRYKNTVYYTYFRKLSEIKNNYFGLCIIFKNKLYCSDVAKLYRLFDAVFNEVILKNGILLKEDNGQLLNRITNKLEVDKEILNIERILGKNINTFFFNDIKELDGSFKQNINNKIPKNLNIEIGNANIIKHFKNNSFVLIHPKKNLSINIIPLYNKQITLNDNKDSEYVTPDNFESKDIKNIDSIIKPGDNQYDLRYKKSNKPTETNFTLLNKLLLGIAILGTIVAFYSLSKLITIWVK
jgi:hypothetical protein